MIIVKFIVNIDDDAYAQFERFMKSSDWEGRVTFELLDTGSKKHIRKARGYFSKYASTKTFVAIEDDDKKVLDVIYKEQVTDTNSWYSLLNTKLNKLLNEH